MRFGFLASVALTIAVLGCSTPEPEAPAPTAPAATAKQRPRPSATPEDGQPKRSPDVPRPTISVSKPEGAPDPRRTETPCNRNEAGWKWVGTVVEDGRCVVGPCTCVQG